MDSQSKSAENPQPDHNRFIAAGKCSSIDGVITVGKELGIDVDYANTGREPAREFVNLIDGFTETADEDTNGTSIATLNTFFSSCQTRASQQGGQVVFPSTGFSSYKLSGKIPVESIDQDLIDGRKILLIQGCFSI